MSTTTHGTKIKWALQVLIRVNTVFLNLANDADLFQAKLFDAILENSNSFEESPSNLFLDKIEFPL